MRRRRKGRPARRRALPALAVAILWTLAGCTMGPDFATPNSWFPTDWFASKSQAVPERNLAPASQPVVEPMAADWWSGFGDAQLTALESRAAAANLDVR